jgi:hypothetical protein
MLPSSSRDCPHHGLHDQRHRSRDKAVQPEDHIDAGVKAAPRQELRGKRQYEERPDDAESPCRFGLPASAAVGLCLIVCPLITATLNWLMGAFLSRKLRA